MPYDSLTLHQIKELTILIKKGGNWGSGFLYMPDPRFYSWYWFATAGHCVYNISTKGYSYDTTVEWFIYTSKEKKEFKTIPYHHVSEYEKNQIMWGKHQRTDLATRLLDDIGIDLAKPGHHPVSFCPIKKLESLTTGLKVDYFGYDDENIDADIPVPQLKHRRGDIDHIDPVTKIFSISGTAVGGFSGGPVFLKEITETEIEGGRKRYSEIYYLIGIMIAVSQPQEKTGLPRNEIKVTSFNLINELIQSTSNRILPYEGDPLSARRRQMKFYIYISDTKVDVLYPQIPQNILEKYSKEFTFDITTLRSSLRETSDQDSRYKKCMVLTDYINKYFDVGMVDSTGYFKGPKGYFKGTIPMKWGPWRFKKDKWFDHTPMVFFSFVSDKIIVGLTGSTKHIIGSKDFDNNVPNISPSFLVRDAVYLFRHALTLDNGILPIDDVKGELEEPLHLPPEYLANIISFATQLMKKFPTQNIEFLAKTLFKGHNSQGQQVLLGSPIYAVLAD